MQSFSYFLFFNSFKFWIRWLLVTALVVASNSLSRYFVLNLHYSEMIFLIEDPVTLKRSESPSHIPHKKSFDAALIYKVVHKVVFPFCAQNSIFHMVFSAHLLNRSCYLEQPPLNGKVDVEGCQIAAWLPKEELKARYAQWAVSWVQMYTMRPFENMIWISISDP